MNGFPSTRRISQERYLRFPAAAKKKHRETNAQYAPLPALSSSSGNWETFAVMHKAWYRIVLLIYILPSLPGPSESEVRMYVQSEAVCACV